MTQSRKESAFNTRQLRPTFRWHYLAGLSVTFASCLAYSVSRAQVPLPPVEAESIEQRLTRQEAEIRWLRDQLAQNQAASLDRTAEPPVSPPPLGDPKQAAGQDTGNLASQFIAVPSAELEGVLRRLETLEKNAAKATAEKKPDDGWIDMSSEKWTVKLGGHVQADFIHWAEADEPPVPAQDYFEFRRLRLLADGTGYGVFDFRIQIDIEPEGEDTVVTPVTVIKDAYLSMNEVPILQRFRIGNFFVPFSLEQVTNDTNNIFMERSIPTQGIFAADREVGVAVYGVTDDKNATWTFGAFLDSISEAVKERVDDNQGHRVSGRVTWLPYYDESSNGRYLFHTGAGVLYTDDQDNVARFRARPQIHEGPFLIDSGLFAAGSSTSTNVELATVWGNISVQSELFLTNVNRIGADNVNLYGTYIYGSYFLTGENRIYERYGQHGAQFSRNVPFTNFFLVPGCWGSGALEFKSRWSYLDLSELAKGQYNDLTVGFNWYWTDRIRVMFDWIHPITTSETPFGATQSDLVATRFDFNF